MSFMGSFFELIEKWLIGLAPLPILFVVFFISFVISEIKRDFRRTRKAKPMKFKRFDSHIDFK